MCWARIKMLASLNTEAIFLFCIEGLDLSTTSLYFAED